MDFFCQVCKKRDNKEVKMIEHFDELKCTECNTTIYLPDRSPLGRFIEGWTKNAETVELFLRPALYQGDLANPRLFYLYEDCYHNMLIGRYNAAIVMMGVLLEALMKERIHLKMGKDMGYSYGTALNVIKHHKLMSVDDIHFLEGFKENIRDLYQHSKEKEIVEGGFIRGWKIKLDRSNIIKSISEGLEKIKSDKLKPMPIPTDSDIVRSVVKQNQDSKKAVVLFNLVYDFLLHCKVRYFKQEEYDEAHRKLEGKKK